VSGSAILYQHNTADLYMARVSNNSKLIQY